MSPQNNALYLKNSFVLKLKASDALSMFGVVQDLFTHLDSIIVENKPSQQQPIIIQPHPLDIFKKFDETINLDSIMDVDSLKKHQPLQIDQFHHFYSSLDMRSESDDHEHVLLKSSKLFVFSHFLKLDETSSQTLFENCRKMKCSIQGMQSLAFALCLINEKLNLISDNVKNINLFNLIPCNVRPFFDVPNNDLMICFGILSWYENLDLSEPLWKLASKMTQKIKEMQNANEGMKYWAQHKYNLEFEDHRLSCSSLGILKLGADYLSQIEIKDVRFFVSPFRESLIANESSANNYVYSYSFTCLKRFHFNVSHSYPRISAKFGRHLARNMCEIVRFFSRPESLNSYLKDLNCFLRKYDNI